MVMVLIALAFLMPQIAVLDKVMEMREKQKRRKNENTRCRKERETI